MTSIASMLMSIDPVDQSVASDLCEQMGWSLPSEVLLPRHISWSRSRSRSRSWSGSGSWSGSWSGSGSGSSCGGAE